MPWLTESSMVATSASSTLTALLIADSSTGSRPMTPTFAARRTSAAEVRAPGPRDDFEGISFGTVAYLGRRTHYGTHITEDCRRGPSRAAYWTCVPSPHCHRRRCCRRVHRAPSPTRLGRRHIRWRGAAAEPTLVGLLALRRSERRALVDHRCGRCRRRRSRMLGGDEVEPNRRHGESVFCLIRPCRECNSVPTLVRVLNSSRGSPP